MSNSSLLEKLKAENTRLIALLEAHGIDWKQPEAPERIAVIQDYQSQPLGTDDKIALFRSLFKGRTDIYPLRWESKGGKSGYSPACGNEWRPGICEKPRIKCTDCTKRQLMPVTDEVVYRHLAGAIVAGVYPLLPDDTCHFLAVDFDEADWRDDAMAFINTSHALGVPTALEVSRSGNGAHVWIFFDQKVPASDARRLGAAIISHTCERTKQLALGSYDRMFPNQDYMPRGGFGNLIALPLQKRARAENHSVFVDETLEPYADQWAFLASIERVNSDQIHSVIRQAVGTDDPLGVAFEYEQNEAEPWKQQDRSPRALTCRLPATLNVTLANLIYFQKAQLPQPLANLLIRLAAFQNPDFYKAQAMRMSVWNKPRIIGCAQNFPKHIALPRGCWDAVQMLLEEHGITVVIQDERFTGAPLEVNFQGVLRSDQAAAVDALLPHDSGILCAPTAFGKTVTAAAIIARRKVNTLVLVHRTELLRQWQVRLQAFLEVDKEIVGTIGGGKIQDHRQN